LQSLLQHAFLCSVCCGDDDDEKFLIISIHVILSAAASRNASQSRSAFRWLIIKVIGFVPALLIKMIPQGNHKIHQRRA